MDIEVHSIYNVGTLILRTLATSYILFLVVIVAFGTPQQESFASATAVPLPPDTGNANYQPEKEEPEQKTIVAVPQVLGTPVHLSIPAIKLDSHIVNVGINTEGEMDVPPGTTRDVGWYKYGTTPGDMGSAVLGAHVYAAFSKLNRLGLGSHIYVTTQGGKILHFVVNKTRTYALADMKPEEIFTSSDGKQHLNLVTCAGKFIKSRNTYDHRFVVYATLVE